ncbi:deoxynucleoside kinase [Caldisericum exile]|uniref:Deoxynucleoside kinase n=1 Tax=Caldisericum exile (strain DSM 21853 / NBRC 104410 / AZM16c01) TaxID=511051 RepID=A0A7U6GG02_CALEA|nr:deoxynucleoside kinase [Caldisericum exile]BAL81626.1 deoxynucleoside kinase [Caldisericum exile AZM16c01]
MYIVISGNIGAGKTSLAQIISEDLGFSVYFEDFHSNLFLKDYYQDMKRWAFATQINFLALRYEQIVHHMLLSKIPAVLDRSIYEDREVFAKSLYEEGLMTKEEWIVYDKLYNLMVTHLPTPNLLIYLEKTVDELLRNIAKRGRDFEKIPREYLESLDKRYKEFYANWHFPKIKITNDIYDNREEIIQRIKNALYNAVY